jgi:hypothetical protein
MANYVTIEIDEVIRETEKAFLFRIPMGSEVWEKWIPKSCIEDPDALVEGSGSAEVNVAEWFAREEDLEPAQ